MQGFGADFVTPTCIRVPPMLTSSGPPLSPGQGPPVTLSVMIPSPSGVAGVISVNVRCNVVGSAPVPSISPQPVATPWS